MGFQVAERTAAALLREWKDGPEAPTAFLMGITADEIERVSRVACKDGHPLQADALAFLRALYATD